MDIFVGNLTFTTTEEELAQLFHPYGEIASVRIMTDRETGRSRGFGFVEMPNAIEANAAIAGLDGTALGGRALTVNEARPREERRPRDDGRTAAPADVAQGRRQRGPITAHYVDISAVIRSCAGTETRRGLCYDQHHVWLVTVVVTLPDTRPCVLRGKWDRWARAVPHPHCGAISSDIGYRDVFVAQEVVRCQEDGIPEEEREPAVLHTRQE